MIFSRNDGGRKILVVFEEFIAELGETEAVVFLGGPFYGGPCFDGGCSAVGVGLDLGLAVEGFVCDGVPAAVGAFVDVASFYKEFLIKVRLRGNQYGTHKNWTASLCFGSVVLMKT